MLTSGILYVLAAVHTFGRRLNNILCSYSPFFINPDAETHFLIDQIFLLSALEFDRCVT